MRIDLPGCGFKNCRKCCDGNCISIKEYRSCEYAINKSMLEALKSREHWIIDRTPEETGEYEVLVLDAWTKRTFVTQLDWDGKNFEVGKDNTVVAWKDN